MDDYQRTLERIYRELNAELKVRGSVINGRIHPAVSAISKIIADIDRRTPLIQPEETDENATLCAI